MPSAIPYDDKNYLYRRVGALNNERSSWMTHWMELSKFLMPRTGRFLITDRNRGNKRHNNIYDNAATRALRVLGAGLMSGATSPARPWIRVVTADPDMMDSEAVKVWCAKVTQIILDIFQRSNTYRSLQNIYEELGAYGTGCMVMADDFESVIHQFPLTAGEYSIAQNWRGDVDTMSREFEKTVENLVGEFGYDNCSSFVKNSWDRGNYDTWAPVCHLIEPRKNRDDSKLDAKNMKYRSVYFEPDQRQNTVLRESGMKKFRALAPRWSISGGDIYGNSPGMEALGHVKEAQHNRLMKGTAIDYQVKPPLQIPTQLKNAPQSRLPGGEFYYDQTNPGGGVRSAFNVQLDVRTLMEDIQDIREQIDETFYVQLFLLLSSNDAVTSKLTATQVGEMKEEKLLMLGPVLERLHNELLSPLVGMTFDRAIETGLLPPAPEELNGKELNVEFVSVLAQAQRAISTNSTDRFVMNLGAIAQFKPGVLDKFDEDKWAEKYADMLGVDPELIVADDKVALIRKAKAQAAQQQAQVQTANVNADTAQKLGNTPTDGNNAATGILNNLMGYGGGQ